MPERIREALTRAALTLLLSLGLLLPLCGVLRLPASAWVTGGVCAALLSAAMGASLLLPHGAWIGAGGALAVGGVWLAAGGIAQAAEVVRGVGLTLSGYGAAIAYCAGPAALLLGYLTALASFVFTGRHMSVFAVMAVMLSLAALWLGSRPDLILLVTPAAGAAMAAYARDRSDGIRAGRALPLVLAAAVLAGLLVPRGGVVIEPLKDAADRLRQTITDYLFFTEKRNEFTLASEGYYPMDPNGRSQLGGPPDLNPHDVMTVTAPRTVYLRGAVLNEYDGHTWRDSTGGVDGQRYQWIYGARSGRRDTVFDAALPAAGGAEAVTVRVRMEGDSYSNLFVPQRVRSLSVGGDLVPYFNLASEVFATRDLAAGDEWTVTAPLLVAGDPGLEDLVARCAEAGDPARDRAVGALYLGLPDVTREGVADTVREAAGSAQTPYARAMAIRDWLRRECRYTLEVGFPDRSVDFVGSFLLSREGYCTYFATAMTVLCRADGIPARYVEGYLAQPGPDGTAIVTGLDAHAWTEIWLSGYGWLTIDATPSEDGEGEQAAVPDSAPPEPTPSPAPPEPTPTPEPPADDQPTPTPLPPEDDQPTPTPDPGEGDPPPTPEPPESENEPPSESETPDESPEDFPRDWWKWLLLILAILLAIAAIVLRFIRTAPKSRAARAKDEPERWQVWMQAVCDALAAAGETRPPDLTLAQWLTRVDRKALCPAKLAPLGECAALVFYGGAEPTPEETAMTRDAFGELFRAIGPVRRARFRLRRAFGRKRDFTGAERKQAKKRPG